MPAITIRDVPQPVRDELAARAAAKGQSLQEYVSSLLRSAAERPDVDTLLARIRARKEATGSVVAAAQILTERDADRR